MDAFIAGSIVALVLIILSAPFAIVGAVVRKRIERELNNRVGTVTTQYEPPHGLSPAEVGLLYDMKVDRKEFIATLFSLEQRKIIVMYGTDDIVVINKKKYATLMMHEKLAVDQALGIVRDAGIKIYDAQTGRLKYEIGSKHFTKKLLQFKKTIKQSVEARGIKLNNYGAVFIKRVLQVGFFVGLWPLLFIAVSGTYNGQPYGAFSFEAVSLSFVMVFTLGLFFLPAYLFAGYILVWLWTKIAGRYWLNSKQARKIWPQLEGYRLFLEKVDLDNIQFESVHEQNPVTKTLPYAIVFGLETKWEERLNNKT